jgi:uncharacterized protein (DUF433 family)
MNIEDYIVCDPKVCGGDPVFKGTRILVYLVLEMLEAGETIEDILKAYPQLTRNHIKATLHYAAEVIKNGEFVPFAEIS